MPNAAVLAGSGDLPYRPGYSLAIGRHEVPAGSIGQYGRDEEEPAIRTYGVGIDHQPFGIGFVYGFFSLLHHPVAARASLASSKLMTHGR